MAFYLSPLVDVNEIDLTTTIPAVATSIGVIVLRNTFKGPENKQILVADEADLIRAFGEPEDDSYEDLMSATGFLKFGNKLYCTRVMPDDARFATNKTTGVDGGAGMLVDVIADDTGVATSIALTATPGSGYAAGEKFEIAGGSLGVVLTETLGIPATIDLVYGHSGYESSATTPDVATTSTKIVSEDLITGGQGLTLLFEGDITDGVNAISAHTDGTDGAAEGSYTGLATTVVPSGGTGCTLDVEVDNLGTITSVTLNDNGSGYDLGDTVSVAAALVGATTGTVDVTVTDLTSAGLDISELTLVDGGTRYVAGQEYKVTGPNGEDGVIRVDVDGTISDTSELTIISAGSGYTAGELTLAVDTEQTTADIATGTLDDIPSGDPDDFGEEVEVAAGDLLWTIASSRGDWADSNGGGIRYAILDQADQIALLQGGPTRSGMPSSVFAGIDSQLDKANDFLVLVQAIDQRKNTWVTKETWNVSTDPNALDDTGSTRFAETVINRVSQYVRMALSSDLVLGDEEDVKADLAKLSSDTWYTLGDGSDGTGQPSDATIIDGYRLYENPEEIDINLVIDSGKSDTVKRDLIAMCEERLDCMTVLDCPKNEVLNNKGNEAVGLRDWRNGTGAYAGFGFASTSYAAVYGNWLEVYDKFNQKYRWIPASGFVTGIFAKTDDVRDPWWAPAGLNRAIFTGVRRLAWNPKLGNRDILYSNGINPIVTFPGEGKVIWGQKTMLSKESAFNRINVRRLFLVLEKAIATAAKYFLFEPNDPATRNQLVNMITPFLRDVQSRRGIYDFKVVCDDTNNTPVRVDRNELWCNIFIKPTRTAEFIVLNFVATATGASFDEAAAAV
jgi:hypothetical protein